MYSHVIVPSDGSLELRAALTPAADLAWRCGAKIVVVSITQAAADASRAALKSQAMSMSSTDVDYWVDLDVDLGDALVEAARHRPDPLIWVASRSRRGLFGRRRSPVGPPPQVFEQTSVPLVVVGPGADVEHAPNLVEVLVLDDGSPAAASARVVGARWGAGLRIDVRVVGVVPDEQGAAARAVRDGFDGVVAAVPSASLQLVRSDDPADAMCAVAQRHRDAMVVTARGEPVRGAPLGPDAHALIDRCSRVVVVAPDGAGSPPGSFGT